MNSAKLRKDLSHIGSSGVRGVGYDVSRLTAEVEAARQLGMSRATIYRKTIGYFADRLAGR